MKKVERNSKKIFVILKYIWKSSPKWTFVNSFFIVLRGILPLLLLFLVKLLVDEIQNVFHLPIEEKSFRGLTWLLIVAGVVFLINSLSASFSTLVKHKQSFIINDFFDDLVHNKITKLKYKYFEHPDYQNVFYRALNEASYRPSKIFYGALGIVQNLITLISMGAVLFMVHWSVFIVLLAITLPIALIRLKHSLKVFNFRKANTRLEREVSYYNRLLTAPDYAKEQRMFNLVAVFKERYEERKRRWRNVQFTLLKIKTIREVAVQLLASLAFFFVYALIAKQAFDGRITMGEVVLYFMAMQRGYSYLQEILARLTDLYEDSLFLDNLFELLDLNESEDFNSTCSVPQQFPTPIQKRIKFDNISFKYPSKDRWIIKDLSFSINVGETIALVGANGSGKSTLIKILCGLYEPTKGNILIDDTPMCSIPYLERVKNISAVFQDFILYNVSARDNIWFGNTANEKEEEKIKKAAQYAGIDKIISEFKNGYDTTLGVVFEDSEQMSPGQWQRLALARSFYSDSQIILLDEPTSSLDIYSEAKLLKYIKSITSGRTSIIVSHRLSTIKMADRIVVLEDKKIVEDGSYDHLIADENSYLNKMVSTLVV